MIRRQSFWHCLLCSCLISLAWAALTARCLGAGASPAIRYTISFASPTEHILHVEMDLPGGASNRTLQLPVWNATYQVRDFSQYVKWVRGRDRESHPLEIHLADKSRWLVSGVSGGAQIEYEIVANEPGPYGAEVNPQHAFLNLAEILMYSEEARSAPVRVDYSRVPENWNIATALPGSLKTGFIADNYDRLVDSPAEFGTFREDDFNVDGAQYRVVVDAESADYDLSNIESIVRRIATTEIAWMDDRPFESFLFIYHFPHELGGGDMEHAYSTAIDLNSRYVADNPDAIAEVTAHELFHLWNVKRIRSQSLEPIDYTRENYTDSLWFSEGVTSTVGNYAMVQSGLLDESHYLRRLGEAIGELESRPAHLTQSAEDASLDAWLEKYPNYLLPERSISYYNKGELLGVILDLALRDATNWGKSLRDLFQWMNANYAKQGKYFADSDGVRLAAEAVSRSDFKPFFQKYIAGTDEIPWDNFFRSVGLRLVQGKTLVADPGFLTTRNFDLPAVVSTLTPGSEAERAGLSAGDAVLEIDGYPAGPNFEWRLKHKNPGDTLQLRIRNEHGERELEWKVGSREEKEFQLKDVDHISAQQRERRAAWLKGESQRPGERAR